MKNEKKKEEEEEGGEGGGGAAAAGGGAEGNRSFSYVTSYDRSRSYRRNGFNSL